MNLSEMEYKELKAKAHELGLDIKGNPKREELEIEIEEAMEKADMEAKSATYEKPNEESKKAISDTKAKADIRQEALKLKKVIITPLDARQKDLTSEMYAVGNKTVGFIKKVVRFNKESLEPNIILKHLREKKMLIQQTSEVNGKKITRKKQVPAFSIQELELTAEELAQITNKK